MDFQALKEGKIKLEFGNHAQIACIDMSKRDEELKNLEEKEDVLKEYEVEFAVSGSATVQVQAFDEEEAREVARDTLMQSDVEEIDFDYLNIRIIGEVE